MIKANFNAYGTYVTDSLYQWDLNQVLSVSGLNLSVAPEVHFSNANMDKAIVRQATMSNRVVTVDIPNSLLQDPLTIKAHIGIYEGGTFKVVEKVEIPVIAKARPSDYQIQDADEEIYSFKALENAVANMTTKVEANVISARIDTIVANANSTEGNSELVDIRVDIAGNTHDSAGSAVRNQIVQVFNHSKETLYQLGLRHGYKARFTNDGSYLHKNGYMHELAGSFSSDLIPCDQFSILRYRTSLDSSGYEVGFYDSDKKLLPGISILGDNFFTEKIVDISNLGAAYVRVSGYVNESKNATKDTIYFVFYTTETIPEIDEDIKIEKTFDTVFGTIAPYGAKFDKVGYFAIGGNGRENTDTNGFCTEFIPCEKYRYLKYKTNIDSSAFEVVFYDANRNILSDVSIRGNNNFIEKIVDISTFGASYIRVCGYVNESKNANSNTAYVYLYNYDVVTELETVKSKVNLKTKDKQILIFGDSITESAYMNDDGSGYTEGVVVNWTKHIPELLNTSNFKNYAKSGAHFADFNSEVYRQHLSNQIKIALGDSENNPDIIVVSLGTNDGTQTPIDSYDEAMSVDSLENLDKTKLYQAIRYALWTLRTNYPNAIGFITTPIQRADREPITEISEAIKKMGRRYNFIVIDAESESGIIRENEKWLSSGLFLKDGLHPNDAGSRKLAELYCSTILNYVI